MTDVSVALPADVDSGYYTVKFDSLLLNCLLYTSDAADDRT